MDAATAEGVQLLTTPTIQSAEAAGTAATLISASEEAETASAASACASTSKEDPPRSQRIKVVLDMETSDPDDMITLCFLADHPNIDLRAVTLTPGTRMQVGLVRAALQALGHREIPIGAGNLDHPNDCVSAWHQKIGLRYEPSSDAEVAWKVLVRECDTDTTLMTGGPLKNIGAAIRESQGAFTCGRWVGQGGFAGEGVVPDDVKWPGNLSEFRHKRVCPTFNFGGDAKSAELAVSYQGFAEIRLVSKNVCHRNVFTQENQTELESLLTRIPTRACPGMRLVARGMDNYCSKGRGKKLHDPLAATCILDLSVCRWEEVKVIHEGALWGSVKQAGTNCFISVDYRPEAFWGVFVSAIMQEAVAADERRKRQSSSSSSSSSSSLRRSVAASAAEAE